MRVNGNGELFNKATGDPVATAVEYDLDFQPKTNERLGYFTREHVAIKWDVAMKALQANTLLALKTTAGFVDLWVTRINYDSAGNARIGVTMTGGFRDALKE